MNLSLTHKKLNPMPEYGKLRRIRAEDLEWSLAVVPSLTKLCLEHIVQNFEGNLFSPLILQIFSVDLVHYLNHH